MPYYGLYRRISNSQSTDSHCSFELIYTFETTQEVIDFDTEVKPEGQIVYREKHGRLEPRKTYNIKFEDKAFTSPGGVQNLTFNGFCLRKNISFDEFRSVPRHPRWKFYAGLKIYIRHNNVNLEDEEAVKTLCSTLNMTPQSFRITLEHFRKAEWKNSQTCERCSMKKPLEVNLFDRKSRFCKACKVPRTDYVGLYRNDNQLLYSFTNEYDAATLLGFDNNKFISMTANRFLRDEKAGKPDIRYQLNDNFYLKFELDTKLHVSRGNHKSDKEFPKKLRKAVFDNDPVVYNKLVQLAKNEQTCTTCLASKARNENFFRPARINQERTFEQRCIGCKENFTKWALFDHGQLVYVYSAFSHTPSKKTRLPTEDTEYQVDWTGDEERRYTIKNISTNVFEEYKTDIRKYKDINDSLMKGIPVAFPDLTMAECSKKTCENVVPTKEVKGGYCEDCRRSKYKSRCKCRGPRHDNASGKCQTTRKDLDNEYCNDCMRFC